MVTTLHMVAHCCTLNFSDVLVPLLLGHQLALVVVGVEADPVEGDGRAEK